MGGGGGGVDRLIRLSKTVEIGSSDYFGFAFTAALYDRDYMYIS